MADKRSFGSRSRPAKRNTKSPGNESNEPAAKALRKTPTDLHAIPTHILLKVFSKLPSKTRVRMRKTCSYMDNFVENNRKALEKTYCKEGVFIDVNVTAGAITFKRTGRKMSYPIGDIRKMVSGLSIRKLSLYINDDTPLQVIKDTLMTADLVADMVCTWNVKWSPEQCLHFSNVAEALFEFFIKFDSIELGKCVPSLVQSRNVEKLTIVVQDPLILTDVDRTIVEAMPNFRAFNFDLNDKDFFKQFLWAIAPDSVRLLTSENTWIVIFERLIEFTATQRIGTSIQIKFIGKGDEEGLLDFLIPYGMRFTPKRRTKYINSSSEERFDQLRRAYFDHMKRKGLFKQKKFLTYEQYLQKENLTDKRNL